METKHPSPTGRHLFRIDPWEPRMSLWIESPTLLDTASDQPLLRFEDPHWSLDRALWLSDSTVQITLRKYPGNHTPPELSAVVDCIARTASVGVQSAIPLEALASHLEQSFTSADGA